EAKVNTSWVNINSEYEEAIYNFINRVLGSSKKHPFWTEFLDLYNEIYKTAHIYSLAQSVLKITSPGVPDIYQGTEIQNLTLVDPDNRKKVNYDKIWHFYEKLNNIIFSGKEITDSKQFSDIENEAIKLFITHIGLNFRKDNIDVFNKGEYIPIEVIGEKSDNIIAFARKSKDKTVITVVPVLVHNGKFPINKDFWADTQIVLPRNFDKNKYYDIFTKKTFETDSSLKLADIFSDLPISVISSF
ncbi:MAG: hypothetical protein PHV68_05570, partial [Candidatus Gastranaerophilales bacterium]|nr:hypothetical protein [Candidatus Gastranaerophilales bacterium]